MLLGPGSCLSEESEGHGQTFHSQLAWESGDVGQVSLADRFRVADNGMPKQLTMCFR